MADSNARMNPEDGFSSIDRLSYEEQMAWAAEEAQYEDCWNDDDYCDSGDEPEFEDSYADHLEYLEDPHDFYGDVDYFS